MPESTTGYLFGIFDLFHIGHLGTIRQAATKCERLIGGVANDDLVENTFSVRRFVRLIERVELAADALTGGRQSASPSLGAALAATTTRSLVA